MLQNNAGQNPRGQFFGIELGSAPLDVPSGALDATGSCGNTVEDNLIYGAHAAGIFLAAGCTDNLVRGNQIGGLRHGQWSAASQGPQRNIFIENRSAGQAYNCVGMQPTDHPPAHHRP